MLRLMKPALSGLLSCLLLVSPLLHGAGLQLITEELPPLSFTRDGQLHGCAYEMVEEIQRRTGSEVPVQVMPWARGYYIAQHEPMTGLFTALRIPEREKLFQWVGPISGGTVNFYARRGSKLMIRSIDDAKAVSHVLITRSSYAEQMLTNMGFTNLEPVKTNDIMARMLLHDRAPLMLEVSDVVPAELARNNAKPSDVEAVYSIGKAEGYIAFSLATPSSLVSQWQRTLDDMKRDGSFQAIFGKCFPGAPIPGIAGPAGLPASPPAKN
ncbi:substrate-binding periplasmic protein [Andreprevotia chitinilytica]|uniref:substrate-binding periplasmic protein n=1 Tax=Andreprevotia chitinilytica TaxID=396808 RepID=UPI000B05A76F|nr:transporter substrate-binding domain-containing protein [Andreprevotia chitinilytica]